MTNIEDTHVRRTRQRSLIDDVLASSDSWLTAGQVHQLLVQKGRPVGLATVYRSLASLAAVGQVDVVRMGQEVGYRRCSPSHHHHLTCRCCGHTVEINEPMESWAVATAAEYGYTNLQHIIEITGVCPHCQAAGIG